MGHLNSFLELGDGNLITKNRKTQMPGGVAGVGGGEEGEHTLYMYLQYT